MQQETTAGLDDAIAALRQRLDATYQTREQALAATRQIVRLCANTIRAIHRRETKAAEELLQQADDACRQLLSQLADHQDLFWAGYVQDALKELAEAHILHGILSGTGIPDPTALNIPDAAYLNGLAEAATELRRYILDGIRHDELEQAETLLAAMDEIYSVLVTIDYPDAVTGGLRRSTDVVRGVLERTRGDLTLTLQNRQLQQALSTVEARLAGGG